MSDEAQSALAPALDLFTFDLDLSLRRRATLANHDLSQFQISTSTSTSTLQSTMASSNNQQPGDDLKRYLILPQPNVVGILESIAAATSAHTLLSQTPSQSPGMDIARLTAEVNSWRGEYYAAVSRENHWRGVAQELMRTHGLMQPPPIINTTTKIPAAEPPGPCMPPVPTYRECCPHRLAGKKCKRRQCKYVHDDQVEMFKDHIAGLRFANKGGEWTSGEEVEAQQDEGDTMME
jgi:hypothetical protein